MSKRKRKLITRNTLTHISLSKQDLIHQQEKKWIAPLLGITLLLSAGGVVASGAWLSYALFFNPSAIASLNQFLPQWAQLPSSQEPTQTLTQIAAELSQQGKIAGKLLPLEVNAANSQPVSVILPVKSQHQQIVELRVYRIADTKNLLNRPKGEIHYQFVTQTNVTGPEESFVVAPLVDPETADTSSNRPLPVTELRRFDSDTPTQGIWFYLWGQRQRGQAIAYGQIVHYNPDRSYLSLILPWTSPTSLPQWQQAIAGSSPELVIDQTVDLEPRLQVYQLKPANFIFDPLQLEPVSIAEPALNSRDYQNALLIARSGLWTSAEKWLQFIKQRQKRQAWSSAAQAQLDFIRLHAEKSQKQANQAWASPSQQALTLLIDGRWGEALKVYQASPTNTQEVAALLKTDDGRLENRIEVALRVNPKRIEVKAWGALLKGAQESRRSAIAWLKQQPQTTSTDVAYIQKFLKRLDGDFSANQAATSHPSRFVGTAQQITQIDPQQWLQIEQTPLQMTQQTWYQIQLKAYYDGNTWQHAPFQLTTPKTATQYWQELGLDADAEVQIISWLEDGYQQIDVAVVKAVQLQNKTLKLLAVSERFPLVDSASQQLALTKTTVQWLQPETIALLELTQQSQPLEIVQILPTLWQELQKSNPNPQKVSMPKVEEMLQQLGELPVQLLDLTGDGTAEVIMTISPQQIAAIYHSDFIESISFASNSQLSEAQRQKRSRTLIFTHTGRLLYSEFGNTTEQKMIAIADLEDDQLPALLIDTGKDYQFKRWSMQHQRFD